MQSTGKLQALLVGLGNPGAKYEKTRHNVGFRFLDYLYGDEAGRRATPGTKCQIVRVHPVGAGWVERFDGLFAEVEVTLEGVVNGPAGTGSRVRVGLLKPQTFMNRSGVSVGAAAKRFSLKGAQTVVCHDELDIPFGDVRFKRSGGEAGHNGLKSISQVLGTRDYYRIRLGIGRPALSGGNPLIGSEKEAGTGGSSRDLVGGDIVDWVLGRFTIGEERRLTEQFDSAAIHLAVALKAILEAATE